MAEVKKSSGSNIVLAIVGGCLLVVFLVVVAAVVLVGIGSRTKNKATIIQTRVLVKELDLTLANFRLEYNRHPWPTAQPGQSPGIDPQAVYQEISGGPNARINKQGMNYVGRLQSKLLRNGVIVDHWGSPLEFSLDPKTQEPVIRSNGPDGVSGTADDIRN